jgi:hypothetical protein
MLAINRYALRYPKLHLVGFGIVGSARRAEQRAWRLTWKLSTSLI